MKRIKSYNVAKVFITSLIILGIISGIIFFLLQNEANQSVIIKKMGDLPNLLKTNHQNMFLIHCLTSIVLIFLAYSIIGVPIIHFYLYYQSMGIGFILTAFYITYKIKGLIFGLLYILFSKFFYFLIIIYICYLSIKISKKMLKTIIYKEKDSLYLTIKSLFLKLLLISVFVVIYDLFLYFLVNNILKTFLFLI